LKEQTPRALMDPVISDGKSIHNPVCRLMLPQLSFYPRIGLQLLFHDPHFNKFNSPHYFYIGISRKNFSPKTLFSAEN
jgi:hypothetical protein